MKEFRSFWFVLLVLALASPIGLYLPEIMKAGAAWGEWGVEEIKRMIGYAPSGMERTADLWKAPFPDYALPGQEGSPLFRLSLSYVLSAFLGIAVCGGGGYLLARWLTGSRQTPRA